MKTIILSDIGFAQILSSASFPINKKLSQKEPPQKEPPPKKKLPNKKNRMKLSMRFAVCTIYPARLTPAGKGD